MNNKKRNEIINHMLQISNNISERIRNNGQEIDNIGYYKEFEFENSGLEVKDIFIVKLKKEEQKSQKSRENEDQQEKQLYEIYDKDNNLIATVDEIGKIQFQPEFLQSLKEISEEYYNTLTLDDVEIEFPEELEQDDLILTKEEIEEKADNKKIEDLSKIIGSKNINSYSEMKVDQTPKFEKLTNKQEIDSDVRVTQTETLADMIPEIKEKGIVKIGIVYSDRTNNQNGRFSFVGIDKNGQIHTIDSLENVEGTTTGQTVTSINSRDGSAVEEEQVAGMVKINGRSNSNNEEEMLSIRQGQYGILEVDYVRADLSRDKSERYMSAPIETDNIYPTTREVRDFMDKSKNVNMNDELRKADSEIDRDGETKMRNIDDSANNDYLTPDDIIILENGSKTTLRKEAEKSKVSPEEFTRRYNERGGKTPDEKIEAIQDEIEEEYGAPNRNR